MTATEELRELLDERGVEWDGESYEGCTFWNDATNLAVASEGIDGMLWVSQSLTPEQAVAATLGSEREGELESLAADMFCWLVDYLTPAQTQAWETRLEELNVPPTWGVRS